MLHKQKKIAMTAMCIFLALFGGFIAGRSYIRKTDNQVYILNESRLLKFVSLGIAAQDMQADQTSTNTALSDGDRQKIKEAITKLDHILKNEYQKHPLIISKKEKSYEVYGSTKQIDITQEVVIKLIGKDRWDLIGKSLSN